MSDGDRDRLLPHAQDGIEEYDNPLPGWWVWIFWATIAFSIGYWVYYELGPGPSVDRKSTRLNSSHSGKSRMPSSA